MSVFPEPLSKSMPVNFQNGAALDTRSKEEKLKDFKAIELIAAFAPVVWTEKPQESWRRFPTFNQDGSGSCVAQTEAKEMGIMRMLNSPEDGYIHFSATHIYQRRNNRPAGGMGAVDARKIAGQGVTLESFVQSQGMSDAGMDSAIVKPYEDAIGEVFKVPNYLELPFRDFESVASMIQTTGKGVMVWFYFTSEEWSREVPVIINPELTLAEGLRHSVTAVDCFLFNGKKYILIEDSAHFSGFTHHLISEEFFKARNWYAGYLQNFKFEDQTQLESPAQVKPNYTFTKVMEFEKIDTTAQDIKALQDILKYEGLFPISKSSTGFYGAITARAVLAWQKRYNVAPLPELESLAGRRVGDKTIAKLNQLYGA